MPDESTFISLNTILQQIKDGFRQFKCKNGVIAKVLIKCGLTDELIEFLKFEGVVITDFVACTMAGGIRNILKYIELFLISIFAPFSWFSTLFYQMSTQRVQNDSRILCGSH